MGGGWTNVGAGRGPLTPSSSDPRWARVFDPALGYPRWASVSDTALELTEGLDWGTTVSRSDVPKSRRIAGCLHPVDRNLRRLRLVIGARDPWDGSGTDVSGGGDDDVVQNLGDAAVC